MTWMWNTKARHVPAKTDSSHSSTVHGIHMIYAIGYSGIQWTLDLYITYYYMYFHYRSLRAVGQPVGTKLERYHMRCHQVLACSELSAGRSQGQEREILNFI